MRPPLEEIAILDHLDTVVRFLLGIDNRRTGSRDAGRQEEQLRTWRVSGKFSRPHRERRKNQGQESRSIGWYHKRATYRYLSFLQSALVINFSEGWGYYKNLLGLRYHIGSMLCYSGEFL
jgi:hypothetical protein